MIKYKISQETWDYIEHVIITNGYTRVGLLGNDYLKIAGGEEECNLELFELHHNPITTDSPYRRNEKLCFNIIWDETKNKITQTFDELSKRFEVSRYV